MIMSVLRAHRLRARALYIVHARAQDGELGFFKGLLKTSVFSVPPEFGTKKPAVSAGFCYYLTAWRDFFLLGLGMPVVITHKAQDGHFGGIDLYVDEVL